MPARRIDNTSIEIPETLILADPNFDKPAEIDILIGAEYFYHLLRNGQMRIPGQSAVFQETNLGWILSGRYVDDKIHSQSHSTLKNEVTCNLIKFQELPILWELGEDSKKKFLSASEEAAEQHYVKTTKRTVSGKYEVSLPFNEKKELLGNSRDLAFQRFYAIERKLEKNPNLKKEYSERIQGYLDAGHMSPLNLEDSLKPGYFLPHHAVIKEDSITTRTRVVYDGSAKTSSGISLNDTFLVGTTLQREIATIVTRFRSHPYVLTADIQQMYRQIQVAEQDRLYQKILWRISPEEPVKIFSLNTVTFGTSCAPFLAIRTLHQLAEDEKDNFPLACEILKEDFYVDDCLTGAKTLDEAHQIRKDLNDLLQKGGFPLRKWASNHPELCSGLSKEPTDNYMSLDLSGTIKTLGLIWDPKSDTISYTVNQGNVEDKITKRVILSQCSQLFDPLNLLGPVVITGKILIQQLWKTQLNWDDPVPPDVQEYWEKYKNQLSLLNKVKFPRFFSVENPVDIQLHGFCDASEKAYGACLYLRSTNNQGIHHSHLICAKSRVAPLKTITIPRLELCSAVLLAKLVAATDIALPIKIKERFFWTDSSIVLNWVNTPPYKLATFVANRVAEIQMMTKPSEWKHVPTQDNPADFISRGQEVPLFLENIAWRNGPSWICENEEMWPKFELQRIDVPEMRKTQTLSILKITQFGSDILKRYSDINKLTRIIAYCKRFGNSCKTKDSKNRETGFLKMQELREAILTIIKLTQLESFSQELNSLTKNQNVDQKSPLFHLDPFVENGLIKVGGRINNAKISNSQKHPAVLPKGHPITKLIIQNEHKIRMHAGVNATLCGIRESYWPIDGKNATRHVIRKCVTCFRAKPREINYLMGSLPKNRVSMSKPFFHSGVDFCGPFYVKEFRLRNRTKVKTYVAIFVCFATKAVHLELANDLSTEAFIACLKRFIGRRGIPSSMHSDNGTNFVGANKELKEMFQQIDSTIKNESTQNYILNNGISWHFIPPRAPHFGGLWEAAVKSFKFHLTRIVGNTLLSYEQLHTYVVEIEAILNSRPITTLSSDPNDLNPLTPGHFLIGNSMKCLPEEDLRDVPIGRLNCWQIIQQMRQHFWNRWHREYLHEMISRSKWQSATNQENIQEGTLVVIKDDNLPPMKWALGRIVATHPGPDKIVRVVTVRTLTGTYKRALKKLYPLPINE